MAHPSARLLPGQAPGQSRIGVRGVARNTRFEPCLEIFPAVDRQRREHDQSSVHNTRRSRDNRLGIVLIWATAAAALVEIKSAAATREMRRKVFFMVQRNSAV
jgi:hypothetical protein